MKAATILSGIACAIAMADALPEERLPTDTELRAAYCVRIVTNDTIILRQGLEETENNAKSAAERAKSGAAHDIEIMRVLQDAQSRFQRMLRDREAVLNRLELYVMPRLDRIETIGMLAAMTRASADIEAMGQETDISVKCGLVCGSDSDCDTKCKAPSSSDLQTRFEGCRKPDWLPF